MGGLSKEEPAFDKKADKLHAGCKDEERNTRHVTQHLRQHEKTCRPQKAKALGDDPQALTALAPNPKPHLLEQKIPEAVRPSHRTKSALAKAGGRIDA